MKRIERFIDLDPCVKWEDQLLGALAEVMERVPLNEAAEALWCTSLTILD